MHQANECYRSGSCRVLKTVEIQKKGKEVEILTSTMRGGFKQLMEQERLNHTQNPTQLHLIVLGELHEQDFFGQEIGRDTSGASIVTNKRCEILMIPKDEVFRFATQETWTQVAASMQKVKLETALGEYEKHVKWAEARRSILLDSISENFVV